MKFLRALKSVNKSSLPGTGCRDDRLLHYKPTESHRQRIVIAGCCWIVTLFGLSAATLDADDQSENSNEPKVGVAKWALSYDAGFTDRNGRYAGGSEILHLETHKGKLYAANSYWMEPSNTWYGGKDPKTPWSQVLRLDRPNGNHANNEVPSW